MIHINSKSTLVKGKKVKRFYVTTVAANYEPTSASQQAGLNTRRGVFTNIRSQKKSWGNNFGVKVQDNTGKVPVILLVSDVAITVTQDKPGKPYILNRKK